MTNEPRVHNKHAGTAPPDAVFIGRGSIWGNPYRIGPDGTRDQVIALYKRFVLPGLRQYLPELRGKHLVCFCAPLTCHGDILLEEANCEI